MENELRPLSQSAGGFIGGFAQSSSQQLEMVGGEGYSFGHALRMGFVHGAIGGVSGGLLYGAGQAATTLINDFRIGGAMLANRMLPALQSATGGAFPAAIAIPGALASPLSGGLAGMFGGLGSNVFMSVTSNNPEAVREAIRSGAIRPTSRYRAGASRTPRHHWLPQRDRAFFNARGITKAEIDRFTSPITQGFHEAIEKYVGSFGGYRSTLMARIAAKEAQYGRFLTRREVLREAAWMRRFVQLQDAKIVSYGAP